MNGFTVMFKFLDLTELTNALYHDSYIQQLNAKLFMLNTE
jgi:hypothetical protein